MADKTGIEWTDATWNPIVGCSIVSKGCTNCYAMQVAHRMERIFDATLDPTTPNIPHRYRALTQPSKAGPVWTGRINIAPDHIITQPLRWTRPRRIFVNSMSDLFHENVSTDWIDKIFAVMALTPQHTYQILTKRPERMAEYLRKSSARTSAIAEATIEMPGTADLVWENVEDTADLKNWPLPNVWLGVSVEDQETANERIPWLLNTTAAIRFVSCEPLLEPVDLGRICLVKQKAGSDRAGIHINALAGKYVESGLEYTGEWDVNTTLEELPQLKLDWVIVGGESGKDARPMHPDWARAIRDQCAEADVPFFFKQWGEWAPGECEKGFSLRTLQAATLYSSGWDILKITPKEAETLHRDDSPDLWRFGKRNVYNCLDGIYHTAYPEKKS